MDKQKLREVCSKGGKAAHVKGTCHIWTPEEAREAGRKGGSRGKQQRYDDERAARDAAKESGQV